MDHRLPSASAQGRSPKPGSPQKVMDKARERVRGRKTNRQRLLGGGWCHLLARRTPSALNSRMGRVSASARAVCGRDLSLTALEEGFESRF